LVARAEAVWYKSVRIDDILKLNGSDNNEESAKDVKLVDMRDKTVRPKHGSASDYEARKDGE
jgi:hypothetical protein